MKKETEWEKKKIEEKAANQKPKIKKKTKHLFSIVFQEEQKGKPTWLCVWY